MRKLILLIGICILFYSCNDSEITEFPEVPVQFGSSVNGYTKATVGMLDLAALQNSSDGFSVCTSGLGKNKEMDNVVVKYTKATSRWSYSGAYFWPPNPSQKVTFTAFAPAGVAGTALTNKGLSVSNFIPSPVIANQIDLLYAPPATFNSSTSGTSGVKLKFNHILTQIVFAVTTTIPSAQSPRIISLTLHAPRCKGNYNGQNWATSAFALDFTFFNNNQLSSTPVISTPLLMVPQSVPAGKNITVVVSINGKLSTQIIDMTNMANKIWHEGEKITYNISIKPPALYTKNTVSAPKIEMSTETEKWID